MYPSNLIRVSLLALMIVSQYNLLAQVGELKGHVVDSLGHGVSKAHINVSPVYQVTTSDENGNFSILLPNGTYRLTISHINYETHVLEVEHNGKAEIIINLKTKVQLLDNVRVTDQAVGLDGDLSIQQLSSKSSLALTSATGDFTKVLATLPGVSSNNELSSVYSVRGGNYDENLIYVNGIKVYRPQIVSAGRQEGLSFINPDMVGSVRFSAGGWQAKYGDKLSSVLDVNYTPPIENEATLDLGLLGGRTYFGGTNKKGDFSYSTGLRHKNTQYLLGTLETSGQYLPRFTDFQTYLVKRLGNDTKLGFLLTSAANRYRTIPEFQETEFGTLQNSFRLSIAFEGRELLNYDTHQSGIILTHAFSQRMISHLTVSGVYSSERENYDLEGGYLLCNLNNNIASNRFNECVTVLGIGTNYTSGRNRLEANVFNVEQRNELTIDNDLIEWGMSWSHEVIDDRLQEFAFVDSADFSQVTASRLNEIDLKSDKVEGYAQYTLANTDSVQVVNFGVRFNYWTYSEQLLVSPRIQYGIQFGGNRNNLLRASWGLYQQHPFYRELRDRNGNFNQEVKAQKSMHYVLGWDRFLTIWGRPFKITSEAYYKLLWDVNLYDVNNVKIRYFANNEGEAYAYGGDLRINGEFIAGTESWFSLGYLKTEEKLNERSSYVRRPMDQRINLGIFFQDHLPNDPSVRVSLNLLFGSGLPFGPPENDNFRNAFDGDNYTRVDIGFAKIFEFNQTKFIIPRTLRLGLDVLNLLGTDNAISYTWIEDVNANQFAVPNALSSRFFNARITAKF